MKFRFVRIRSFASTAVVSAAAILAAGTSPTAASDLPTTDPSSDVGAPTIEITGARDIRAIGETLCLNATVRDERGRWVEDVEVHWAALDPDVLAIGKDATVWAGPCFVALTVGTGRIEARVAGTNVVDTATVQVEPDPNEILAHMDRQVLTGVGDTIQIHPEVQDYNGHPIPGAAVTYALQKGETGPINVDDSGRVTATGWGVSRVNIESVKTRDGERGARTAATFYAIPRSVAEIIRVNEKTLSGDTISVIDRLDTEIRVAIPDIDLPWVQSIALLYVWPGSAPDVGDLDYIPGAPNLILAVEDVSFPYPRQGVARHHRVSLSASLLPRGIYQIVPMVAFQGRYGSSAWAQGTPITVNVANSDRTPPKMDAAPISNYVRPYDNSGTTTVDDTLHYPYFELMAGVSDESGLYAIRASLEWSGGSCAFYQIQGPDVRWQQRGHIKLSNLGNGDGSGFLFAPRATLSKVPHPDCDMPLQSGGNNKVTLSVWDVALNRTDHVFYLKYAAP